MVQNGYVGRKRKYWNGFVTRDGTLDGTKGIGYVQDDSLVSGLKVLLVDTFRDNRVFVHRVNRSTVSLEFTCKLCVVQKNDTWSEKWSRYLE